MGFEDNIDKLVGGFADDPTSDVIIEGTLLKIGQRVYFNQENFLTLNDQDRTRMPAGGRPIWIVRERMPIDKSGEKIDAGDLKYRIELEDKNGVGWYDKEKIIQGKYLTVIGDSNGSSETL